MMHAIDDINSPLPRHGHQINLMGTGTRRHVNKPSNAGVAVWTRSACRNGRHFSRHRTTTKLVSVKHVRSQSSPRRVYQHLDKFRRYTRTSDCRATPKRANAVNSSASTNEAHGTDVSNVCGPKEQLTSIHPLGSSTSLRAALYRNARSKTQWGSLSLTRNGDDNQNMCLNFQYRQTSPNKKKHNSA